MAMVWKNSEAFKEHVEQMRMFRQIHTNDLGVRVSRRDLINSMWPLIVTNTTRDTGGSRRHFNAEEWPGLAPIRKVTLSGGSQH